MGRVADEIAIPHLRVFLDPQLQVGFAETADLTSPLGGFGELLLQVRPQVEGRRQGPDRRCLASSIEHFRQLAHRRGMVDPFDVFALGASHTTLGVDRTDIPSTVCTRCP